MRASAKSLLVRSVLASCLGLVLAGPLAAQSFTTLHSFSPAPGSPATNSDGAWQKILILTGHTLYGTAYYGGAWGNGTVFAMDTDGSGFTTLHSFTGSDDGISPGWLLLSGSTLYGTTLFGGPSGNGTVFALSTNGTVFRTLRGFTGDSCLNCPNPNTDGANPSAGLVLTNNTLYGATQLGGTSGNGTVFALRSDGAAYAIRYEFPAASPCCPSLNGEGADPNGLSLSGDTLYGTAKFGGDSGNGTVLAVNVDGTGFRTLHHFTPTTDPTYTNSDGSLPLAGLIVSGEKLYGTTRFGGALANGTVFAINTDGTTFTVLHTFTGGDDGAGPSGLILSGKTLYGTTGGGGSSSNGTVFAINLESMRFTTLYTFTALDSNVSPSTNSDGAYPDGGLVVAGGTLYGTTLSGGSGGNGTVFSISLPMSADCVTPAAGLMAWWPGDGDASDIAGTNNGVLLSGATATAPGLVGGAFSFNGVNSYAVLPNLVGGQAEGTVEGWFKLRTWNWSSGCCGLFLWAGAEYPPGSDISWDAVALGTHPGYSNIGGELMFGLEGADWNWAHSGVVPQLNQWYHVAGTWGAGGISIYVNGVLQGSNPYSGPIPNSVHYNLVGRSSWPGSVTDGLIDEFSLYNRSLSSAEVAGIYAAGAAGKCKQPRLTVVRFGTDMVLTWPTNASGFTLQSATNLVAPVWATNSSVPVEINGLKTVTNPISGAQQFYRLGQ